MIIFGYDRGPLLKKTVERMAIMISVFVDYENVIGYYGLTGAEYLSNNDDLCIFYSKDCANIRRVDSIHIEESDCSFRLCKLEVTRKNALDFYIATEAGIACKSGVDNIIIVTRDSGLESIRDYFKIMKLPTQLIIAPTIERGLLNIPSRSKNEGIKLLTRKNERIDLSAEWARIDEHKRMRRSVIECFSGTEYAGDISRVLSCVEKAGTSAKKDLYRNSIHEFGRISGTVIYNMLKEVV